MGGKVGLLARRSLAVRSGELQSQSQAAAATYSVAEHAKAGRQLDDVQRLAAALGFDAADVSQRGNTAGAVYFVAGLVIMIYSLASLVPGMTPDTVFKIALDSLLVLATPILSASAARELVLLDV